MLGYVEYRDKISLQDVKNRTTNHKSHLLTSQRIPFKASNLSAMLTNGVYVVWSYRWWPLYVYKDGVWYENKDRYSQTTSKQKSQSRPFGDTQLLSHSEIKKLI